jgi:hypothetical protein
MDDAQSSAPVEDEQLIDPRVLTKEQLIDELLSFQQHYQVLQSEKLALETAALQMADAIERLELANSLNQAKLHSVMSFLIDPEQMTATFECSYAEFAIKFGRDHSILSKEMRPIFTVVAAALGHRILRMLTGEMPTHVEQSESPPGD